MSRRRRNETEEQRARRELISDFLSAANIQSMDDIQELFKEALSGFMEGSLESELDSELGYEPCRLHRFSLQRCSFSAASQLSTILSILLFPFISI